jgi:hypothetical protein
MVDITEVSAVVAAAGVLIGVVYYILDMRHQRQVRQTDFITRLYSTYGSKEFHDMVMEIQSLQFNDYEDFVKKYGPWFSKGPAQTAIYIVATYLSEVGVIVRRKIIDIDFFYDIFGSAAVSINWEKLKPLILGIREERHNPSVFSPFEYLYNELQKKEQAGIKSG